NSNSIDWAICWQNRMSSVELLHPDIADKDLGGSFDFDPEEAGLIIRGLGIVIDEDRHELAVENMHAGAASGDDRIFVPVVHFRECAERLTVADLAHQTFSPE